MTPKLADPLSALDAQILRNEIEHARWEIADCGPAETGQRARDRRDWEERLAWLERLARRLGVELPGPSEPDSLWWHHGWHDADPPTPELLTALAERVLGSTAEANEWLSAPHPLLGDRSPREVAATQDGARRVECLLRGLEHSWPT